MNSTEKNAVSKIRAALGLKRLDPRRLFIVDDGAYKWIGDRADLTAKNARDLSAINVRGRRPDRYGPETTEGIDYDALCRDTSNISSTCGGGLVSWNDLPKDWRDGSALGPILPIVNGQADA